MCPGPFVFHRVWEKLLLTELLNTESLISKYITSVTIYAGGFTLLKKELHLIVLYLYSPERLSTQQELIMKEYL